MIRKIFEEQFATSPSVEVMSPGRINVIGEHTDYNEGFVLPAAIDKYGHVAASRTGSDIISLYAIEFNEKFSIPISDIKPVEGKWTNYVLGVVDQLIKRNYKIDGFNLVVTGDVPVGAGLSSSAAIECSVCYALDQLFGLRLSKFDIAKISQIAEHTFPGVQCGIMDQFASVFGKKDHALKLDCRSLQYEEVPLVLKGYQIVLLNTNVKHSLASTAYNERREQCAAGVRMIKAHVQNVISLRDVTVNMLNEYVKDPLIYKRCRFIVEENNRVHMAVEQMKSGNIAGLGTHMFRSHEGLQHEYEVSCPELDWLVDAVRGNPLVAGARMMGGGFGGCTINIIKDSGVEELVNELSVKYEQEMGKKLTHYEARTSDGTHLV
ncbi:MAG TPA: galactokinase [Flavitalea sp.]|nr:galactokinase [Flavitalea sp.]